jgi:hypothetical protein
MMFTLALMLEVLHQTLPQLVGEACLKKTTKHTEMIDNLTIDVLISN